MDRWSGGSVVSCSLSMLQQSYPNHSKVHVCTLQIVSFTHTYTHTRVHTHSHMYTHTLQFRYLLLLLHTYISSVTELPGILQSIRKSAHVYTYIHIYIFTYTYTHIIISHFRTIYLKLDFCEQINDILLLLLTDISTYTYDADIDIHNRHYLSHLSTMIHMCQVGAHY